MKYGVSLAILFALYLAGPVQAEDGRISQATLQSLGLGGMQALSDDEGLTVRGMSSAAGAAASGTSVVSGLLLDSYTNSFVLGTDANRSSTATEGFAKYGVLAYQTNNSEIHLGLIVNTPVSSYTGFLFGGAGGGAIAGN